MSAAASAAALPSPSCSTLNVPAWTVATKSARAAAPTVRRTKAGCAPPARRPGQFCHANQSCCERELRQGAFVGNTCRLKAHDASGCYQDLKTRDS